MFSCTLLYVHSSFAIILMWKRELVALLSFPSLCLVIVVWLLLAVPWVCLQFVIVVFPEHIHLLFLCKLPSRRSHGCLLLGKSKVLFYRKVHNFLREIFVSRTSVLVTDVFQTNVERLKMCSSTHFMFPTIRHPLDRLVSNLHKKSCSPLHFQ